MEETADSTCYIKGDLIDVEGYDNNNNPTPVKCKVTIPGEGFIGIEILDKELDSGKNLVTNLGAGDNGKHWFISTNKIIKNLNSYHNTLKPNPYILLDKPIKVEQI